MGLESVEIVMGCEEAFGVEITDTEGERILTPGDLIRLMNEKVGPAGEGPCMTQRAFNHLRAALATAFGVERSWVETGTPVEHLLPRGPRWAVLRELQWRSGRPEWPALCREGPFGPVAVVPDSVRTVADLTRWLVLHGPIPERRAGADDVRRWTRSEVRTTVRRVVARELGLDDFEDEDELVRDLGMS